MTKWAEAEPIETCTKEVATKFIYENIIRRFGWPLTLISDQGTHIVNETIHVLLNKFLIDHKMTLLKNLIRHHIKDSLKYVTSKRMNGMTKFLQSYGHTDLLISDRLDIIPLNLYMDTKL